jgi:gas vesicle protein
MAYEYDRFEREEGGGSFLMGLLAGTVLGAGLGMLFAPKAGSELRNQLGSQLADQTGRLREVADQGYHQASEKVSQMMDRGREAYDRARSNVGTMAAAGTTGSTTTPGTGGSTGLSGSTSTPGSTRSTGSNIGTTSSQGGTYGS